MRLLRVSAPVRKGLRNWSGLMIVRSGLGLMIAAFAVAPAFAEAADLGTHRPQNPQPEYVPPILPDGPVRYNWSGLYWGLSAGYGWGESTQSYDRNDNHGLASTSPEGFLGSVTLGYNYQTLGGLLIGLEGDLGLMDVSADDKIVYDGHIYKTSYGPLWGTLRGRAGYAFGQTLLYGTAGLAFMDVDDVSIGNTPGETALNEDFKTGLVIGAGIEQALGSGMSLKLEYLHMDFGTYEGTSANNEDFSFKNDVDLVRAGVNYKF